MDRIKSIIPPKALDFIKKNYKYILLLTAAAILLFFGFRSDNTAKAAQQTEQTLSAGEYCDLLEKSVAKTVQSIVGGEPTVMVTLKNGMEYVYANEEKSNTDENETDNRKKDSVEKKIVVLDSNGNQVPLTVTEYMPEIKGLVIVCNGGNDNAVQSLIKETVSVALGVESQRVCVTGTLLKSE